MKNKRDMSGIKRNRDSEETGFERKVRSRVQKTYDRFPLKNMLRLDFFNDTWEPVEVNGFFGVDFTSPEDEWKARTDAISLRYGDVMSEHIAPSELNQLISEYVIPHLSVRVNISSMNARQLWGLQVIAPYVRELVLLKGYRDEAVLAVVSILRNISRLHLVYCDDLKTNTYDKITNIVPGLTHLTVQCEVYDGLVAECTHGLTRNSYELILKKLNRLEYLDVSGQNTLFNAYESFPYPDLREHKTLVEFRAADVYAMDAWVIQVLPPTLRALTIDRLDEDVFFTTELFEALSCFTNLEYLSLQGAVSEEPTGEEEDLRVYERKLGFLQHLPLKVLDIRNNASLSWAYKRVPDIESYTVFNALQNSILQSSLVELYISDCEIEREEIEPFLRNCPRLQGVLFDEEEDI